MYISKLSMSDFKYAPEISMDAAYAPTAHPQLRKILMVEILATGANVSVYCDPYTIFQPVQISRTFILSSVPTSIQEKHICEVQIWC